VVHRGADADRKEHSLIDPLHGQTDSGIGKPVFRARSRSGSDEYLHANRTQGITDKRRNYDSFYGWSLGRG
jgi:hypothetical protein